MKDSNLGRDIISRSRHGTELGVTTKRFEVATTRDGELKMKSQLNIEVATGNLKLSQAKSQLGKSKLQPHDFQGPQGRSRPITKVAT